MNLRSIAFMMLPLGGCTSVEPAARQVTAAEAWVRAEQSPLTVDSLAVWHAVGDPSATICGEIVAPPALREYRRTLRYVFYSDLADDPKIAYDMKGMIEPHELTESSSERGRQILDEGRRVFDNSWASDCAPYAPWQRRVASWFGNPPLSDGGSDTPIVNDAMIRLRGNR